MANKPMLFSEDFDDAERFDPEFWEGRGSDPSFVPGYSEIVQANDIAHVDDLEFRTAMRNSGGKIKTKEDAYHLIGASPQELPIELAWLPISGPNGGGMSPDQRRQLDTYVNRKGFRLASAEVLKKYGYGTTQAMSVAEDGTIRRGPDTALYYRSGEVARKWKRHQERKAAQMEGREVLDAELQEGNYVAPTFAEREDSVEHIAHK